MRNTFVPHVERVPWVAGLPFLSVTCVGLLFSRFVLQFMQFASMRPLKPPRILGAPNSPLRGRMLNSVGATRIGGRQNEAGVIGSEQDQLSQICQRGTSGK